MLTSKHGCVWKLLGKFCLCRLQLLKALVHYHTRLQSQVGIQRASVHLVVSGGLRFPSRLLLSQNRTLSIIFPPGGPGSSLSKALLTPQLEMLLKRLGPLRNGGYQQPVLLSLSGVCQSLMDLMTWRSYKTPALDYMQLINHMAS